MAVTNYLVKLWRLTLIYKQNIQVCCQRYCLLLMEIASSAVIHVHSRKACFDWMLRILINHILLYYHLLGCCNILMTTLFTIMVLCHCESELAINIIRSLNTV